MSSWYIADADGTHFNWNKEPTFECPNARFELREESESEPHYVDRLIATPEIEQAAPLLGLTAQQLVVLLHRAHARSSYGRKRIDGRLTNECASCGRTMKRLGFRAWIDEPIPEADQTEGQRASAQLGDVLGFSGEQRRTLRTTWHPTKKAAEAWARHERKRAMA